MVGQREGRARAVRQAPCQRRADDTDANAQQQLQEQRPGRCEMSRRGCGRRAVQGVQAGAEKAAPTFTIAASCSAALLPPCCRPVAALLSPSCRPLATGPLRARDRPATGLPPARGHAASAGGRRSPIHPPRRLLAVGGHAHPGSFGFTALQTLQPAVDFAVAWVEVAAAQRQHQVGRCPDFASDLDRLFVAHLARPIRCRRRRGAPRLRAGAGPALRRGAGRRRCG